MSSEAPTRVPYIDLANKRCIACFVRSDVSQMTVETFEESFAIGRSHWTDWVACPTRSHQEKSINDLLDLCASRFSSLDNPFYPYFFIMLDERTSRDESVLLVQRDPWYPGTWDLRISAPSLSVFLSCADTGHTTIESLHANEGYSWNAWKDVYIHDVPFDYGALQKNVHVSVSEFREFTVSRHRSEGFTKLFMPKDNIAALDLPAVDLEMTWFGELKDNACAEYS